jgi:succinyl-CoA synthetase beta subunit/citryl-CoA synthetase large subunit
LSPANYTEYSGNPPKEKVYELAKIVLSKPGIRGLWIAGAVANFTDIAATFAGIIQALDEVQPTFPIVVRRAGPNDIEALALMQECAKRNGFPITIFGKEVGIDETVKSLVALVNA